MLRVKVYASNDNYYDDDDLLSATLCRAQSQVFYLSDFL